MLELIDIDTFYGKGQALHRVSLNVSEGEIVSLMGRNGAGKSTLLRTIMGITPPSKGKKIFREYDITNLPPHKISRLGIAYVPENQEIFPNLTILENLQIAQIAAYHGKKAWSIEEVLQYFPNLKERKSHRGIHLSGGESQMLAVARALMMNPDLLLLDEPFEGLAPLIIDLLKDIFIQISQVGITILMVEQNVRVTLELASRHYILNEGHIEFERTTQELESDIQIINKYLGV